MSRKTFYRTFIVIFSLIFVGLSSFLYSTGAFGAASYASLQWCAENHFNRSAKVLLALGTPPSPKKSMIDWHYFALLTNTPLHTAAKNGDVSLLDSLISHDASIDWCCCSCVTALHYAIISKNAVTVERLLTAGADTSIRYDMGPNALELATDQSTPEITAMIAEHNQKLNKILVE